MITKEQYAKLKSGDVVMWRGERPRIVHEGPGDRPGRKAVTFAKLMPGTWRSSGSTIYWWHELNALGCTLPPKRVRFNLRVLCAAEKSRLVDIGIDPVAAMRKDIEIEERLNEAFGRKPCRALRRMKAAYARLTNNRERNGGARD